MQNHWKVATLGLLALSSIVATSTLTTAYLLRPPVSQPEDSPSAPAPAPEHRAAVVRVAPVAKKSTSPIPPPTPPRTLPATTTETSVSVPPAPTVIQSAPSTSAVPADCDTGSDRAVRIAKPGALGAVLGAGLGAAGGAIANGGKGAGQGALIGGLAGATLGAGYGAYKTQTECGTVFGDHAR